ncbi:MAG TPA: hypothetical protein VL221_15710 [Bacteroidota bacterium]|nr:hypothetical protein [Bacteroidota bacterium]
MSIRSALTAACLICVMPCAAQRLSMPPMFVRQHSISIEGGWSWPESHAGLTKYWGPGPGASVEFLTSVSRSVALGFSIDGSAYWFRGPAFVSDYPNIPFRNPPVAQIVAGVVSRLTIAPGRMLRPYLGAMVGISHMTGAEYRQVTDTTSATYFYLPFETRLAVGVYGGIEYRFSRAAAFNVEARALYVNNDPNVGLSAVVRSGFRFFF